MTPRVLLLVPLLAAAACSPERQPPPQPASRPQSRPVAAPMPAPPPPAPAPVGWADLSLTPGTWTYEGAGASTSSATFGTAASPVFRLSCEGATRSIFVRRFGAGSTGTMAIRTSFGVRSLPITPGPQFATATLAARDPLLDNMMFSRGRFSVEVGGTPRLVMPSWAEPARVVEDCRR